MAKAAVLVDLLESLSNQPQQVIVDALVKQGSLDSLVEMKLGLVQSCQEADGFPKGELYRRRRPRGQSAFASLEHRLAYDICELYKFLDTGIVTPEIRSMFKSNADGNDDNCGETAVLKDNTNNYSPVELEADVGGSFLCPGTGGRNSGWSGLKTEMSELHGVFILFRDQVLRRVSALEQEVQHLNVTVKSQGETITALTEENNSLRQHLKPNNNFNTEITNQAQTTDSGSINIGIADCPLSMQSSDTGDQQSPLLIHESYNKFNQLEDAQNFDLFRLDIPLLATIRYLVK